MFEFWHENRAIYFGLVLVAFLAFISSLSLSERVPIERKGRSFLYFQSFGLQRSSRLKYQFLCTVLGWGRFAQLKQYSTLLHSSHPIISLSVSGNEHSERKQTISSHLIQLYFVEFPHDVQELKLFHFVAILTQNKYALLMLIEEHC